MDDRTLEDLLRNKESERVEFKPSLSQKEKICEAICAFANDLPNHRKPGVVFIGVNDDGTSANFQITDEKLRDLSGWGRDGNLLPFPVMSVEKRQLSVGEIAAAIVHPSDSPPVRYRGRIWVRVGPGRAVATAEEERRLIEKRISGTLPFDLRPAATAGLNDLDLDFFRKTYLPSSVPPDVLEQNQRSVEQQLASMRLATVGSAPVPTVLGILTVGKDPRQFLPCDYIQFLRLDGTELTDPIKDQKEFSGPVSEMLRMLDEVLNAHVSIATDITAQPIEIRRPDYPIVALQQLTRNAVLHRAYEGTHAPVRITWFNDRIEIQNPGGPYGQVTRQNFGHPGITDYRNPHLAEAMKNLGYVQRFGVGIQLARKELEKNGNPALEFKVEDSHVLAIVRKRS